MNVCLLHKGVSGLYSFCFLNSTHPWCQIYRCVLYKVSVALTKNIPIKLSCPTLVTSMEYSRSTQLKMSVLNLQTFPASRSKQDCCLVLDKMKISSHPMRCSQLSSRPCRRPLKGRERPHLTCASAEGLKEQQVTLPQKISPKLVTEWAPVIPAFRRFRQENCHKFKASLKYMISSRPAYAKQ